MIEDEPGIRAVLRVLLEAESYRVVEADTADRGEIEARTHKPDLSAGRPGAARRRRTRGRFAASGEWSSVPIVVLSARTMESQKIAALDAGRRRLRHQAVQRAPSCWHAFVPGCAGRRAGPRPRRYSPSKTCGSTSRVARLPGPQGAIRLTPLEYRVLECLARQSGLIVTTRQLLREAWGPERVGESGALRVCIKSLRDKLEPDPRRPRFIVTEAGVGYRLKPADSGDA